MEDHDNNISGEPEYILREDIDRMKRLMKKGQLPNHDFILFWQCMKQSISLSWRILGYGKLPDNRLLYDPQLVFTRREGLKLAMLENQTNDKDYFIGASNFMRFIIIQCRLFHEDSLSDFLHPLLQNISLIQETISVTGKLIHFRSSTESMDALDSLVRHNGIYERNGSKTVEEPNESKRHEDSVILSQSKISKRPKSEFDSCNSCGSLSSTECCSSFSDSGLPDDHACYVKHNFNHNIPKRRYTTNKRTATRPLGVSEGLISVGPEFQVSELPLCQPKPFPLSVEEYENLFSNRIWCPESSMATDPIAKEKEQSEEIICGFLRQGMIRTLRAQCWTGAYSPSFQFKSAKSNTDNSIERFDNTLFASSSSRGAPVHTIGTVCRVKINDGRFTNTLNYNENLSENKPDDTQKIRLVCIVDFEPISEALPIIWQYIVFDGDTTFTVHPQEVIQCVPGLSPSFLSLHTYANGHFQMNEESLLTLLYNYRGNVVKASRKWKKQCKQWHRIMQNMDDANMLFSNENYNFETNQDRSSPESGDNGDPIWTFSEIKSLVELWESRGSNCSANASCECTHSMPMWVEDQIKCGVPLTFETPENRLELDNYMPPLHDWFCKLYLSQNIILLEENFSEVANDDKYCAHSYRSRKSFFRDMWMIFIPALVSTDGETFLRMIKCAWEVVQISDKKER